MFRPFSIDEFTALLEAEQVAQERALRALRATEDAQGNKPPLHVVQAAQQTWFDTHEKRLAYERSGIVVRDK